MYSEKTHYAQHEFCNQVLHNFLEQVYWHLSSVAENVKN